MDGNSPSNVVNHLSTFPVAWPFPRGDLYHWIPALNKFDEVYDTLVKKYKLKDGPQIIYFEGGDEILLLAVINFSRMLVEECGNRSIYASSSVSMPYPTKISTNTSTAPQRPDEYHFSQIAAIDTTTCFEARSTILRITF